MATIPAVIQSGSEGVGAGSRIITWTGLTTANNAGDYIDVTGWLIASVDWQGVFGAAGNFALNGTNFRVSPPVGTALSVFTATAVGLISPSPLSCALIKPVLASGGDGTTLVNCAVMLVR
jgi:hypothetical protein